MITGDKNFASSERFKLQAAQVEKLEVLYWGPGALWPRLPKEKFDVVTAQDPFWRGRLAWHISKKLGARLNIQVHTDLSAYSWWKRAWAGFNLRKAASVRVVSKKIMQQVESLEVAAPIYVLPIYVDLSRFQNIVRAPHAQKTILWVGRFESEKDPLLAIQVFTQLLQKVPDAKLIMLGKGSLENSLRAKAAPLPVEFPGWQDPVAYLAQADVVLSTSQHESWGASIIEALAAGVPVVAPDVGAAREAGAVVAEHGELAQKVAMVLKTHVPGRLLLSLPNAQQWAAEWKQSL